MKNNICTLKKASTDTTNKVAMCESKMIVVNFDNIPKEYAKDRDWDGVPKSLDIPLSMHKKGVTGDATSVKMSSRIK